MSKSIFISHSVKDKLLAQELVMLIEEGIGVPESEIFCSSLEGYSIPTGKNFITHTKEQLSAPKLVVPILTDSYFGSDFCMSELGAAWIKSHEIFPVIVPPLEDDDVKGVLLGVRVSKVTDLIKYNELQETIRAKITIQPRSAAKWDMKRDAFLRAVNSILDTRQRDAAYHRPIQNKSGMKTVWFLGSSTEMDIDTSAFVDKLIPELANRLVVVGARAVVGDSEMLRKIAVAFRASIAGAAKFVPNPVVIEGSLRDFPADQIFSETIGRVPDVAIIIGGSASRGRVAAEYENAVRSKIPVLSIGCLGGAARDFRSTIPAALALEPFANRGIKLIDPGQLARTISQIVSDL